MPLHEIPNGFDFYNEFRAGYRLGFRLGTRPMLTSLQYAFGFGIHPGNKPDNYLEAIEDQPTFHAPSISVGISL